MQPTSFDDSNHVFDKPPNMSYEECEALSVFVGPDQTGQTVVISCWKPTKEELEEINKTGRVWCWHFGDMLQPHVLDGHNPFKVEK